MGKKVSWFAAVRNIFKLNAKDSTKVKALVTQYDGEEKIDELVARNKIKSLKAKGRWSFGKSKQIPEPEDAVDQSSLEGRISMKVENEQDKHALAVAAASAAAAEAAVAAAYAAAEVVRLTGGAQSPCIVRLSKQVTEATGNLPPVSLKTEDWAAIRIQTAFRGYLARRALRALRGLVRLQALVRGQAVRRQASRTFRCMQAIVRIQARIRAMRLETPHEEHGELQWTVFQRKLAQMPECKGELDVSELETWDASMRSAEEKLLKEFSKREAALKRERGLAYAASHQSWRCSPPDGNSSGTDHESDKLQWRWTWLERWMAARSREAPHFDIRALDHHVNHSRPISTHYAVRALDHDLGHIKPIPTAADLCIPRHSVTKYPDLAKGGGAKVCQLEVEDSLPMNMTPQRQSFALGSSAEEQCLGGSASSVCSLSRKFGSLRSVREGSSVAGDDDSIASSPQVPNYMSSTHSAKAKVRLRSLSTPKQRTPGQFERDQSLTSARKRLSFPAIEGSVGSARSTPKHPRAFGLAEQSPKLESFAVPAVG